MVRDWSQNPPFAIQVELAEGCTLACRFCGIRGIREKPNAMFKFMRLTTAHALAAQIQAAVREHRWNPRIEFAMHGEPTTNPHLFEIVRAFRARLPRAPMMITTNGTPLADGRHGVSFHEALDQLFAAGMNIVALDDYRGMTVAREHALGYERDWCRVGHYPADQSFNPHQRSRPSMRMLTIVADIEQGASDRRCTHTNLGNHAGSAGPLDFSKDGTRCAKPFRELSIRWDGHVAICCNDWRGTFKVGNVLEDGIVTVWHHPVMYAARRKLYCGQRDFGPCAGCNHISHRTSLLPDRQARIAPAPPTGEDERLVAEALAGEPYTEPVLRVWEGGAGGRPQPGIVGGAVRMVGADGAVVR